MIMKEHDDNTFTKEKTDVEKYLSRIIQRYFETENNYSKASVESIIVESITRFKRYCKDKGKGYIFSLNQQAGHIVLDIGSFGGEPMFDKNTAYNKDFGDTADTICDGYDLRLSDMREPYTHYHTIAEVDGLEDLLKTFNIPEYVHHHKNQSIIDMLRYTGRSLEVDLLIIERMKTQMLMYETKANGIEVSMLRYQDSKVNSLKSSIFAFNKFIDETLDSIKVGAQWVNEIKKELEKKDESIKENVKSQLKNLLTKEQFNKVKDTISSVYSLNTTKTELLNGTPTNVVVQDNYSVFNTAEDVYTIPTNDFIKAFFQYEDGEGKIIRCPLPFVFNDKLGNPVIIQSCVHGSSITISTNYTAKLPGIANIKPAYKNGKVAVVATRQHDMSLSDSMSYIKDNGYAFVDYDPSDSTFLNLIAEILGDETYHVGAVYNEEDNACYHMFDDNDIHISPNDITNKDWAYIYCTLLNNAPSLYTGFDFDMRNQLIEIPVPKLSDYYNNPHLYYEVFKEVL